MTPRLGARAGLALLAVSLAGSLAYWPGLMIWDSARQYAQAMSGVFDDWHPPIMEAIWRGLLPLSHGPAPMLALQLALYGAGLGLMIAWAARGGRGARALAIGACALLPLPVAMMGEVIKDSLMAAVLTASAALWLTAQDAEPDGAPLRRLAAAALALLAAAIRFNGFIAAWPLLWVLPPPAWRKGRVGLAISAALSLAALLAVMPLTNAALHARKSGVELSLVIFDLAGIGYYSHTDVFPPLGLADAVAVNRDCYRPARWDSYAEWTPEPCDIHFDAVRESFARIGVSPRLWQARAILAHPLAWIRHRAGHFNIETGFAVRRLDGRPIPARSDPNAAGSQITPWLGVQWVDRAARWSALTPLGWPCCWLAAALGVLILSPCLPQSGRQAAPLAASGLLYGLGYAVFGVASDERYFLWTTIATALAAVVIATDTPGLRRIGRARLIAAAAPLALVILIAVAARLA